MRQFGFAVRQVAQEVLDDPLGAPVDALRLQRRVLGDRQRVGLPVDRRRRAEHARGDARLAHHLGQRQRAADVDVVVRERPRLGLADRLQPRAVDDAGDRVVAEGAAQRVDVAHVGLDARHRHAGERFEARQDRRRTGDEAVEDDRRVARLRELDDHVRADVARATGDEDGIRHRAMLPHRRAAGYPAARRRRRAGRRATGGVRSGGRKRQGRALGPALWITTARQPVSRLSPRPPGSPIRDGRPARPAPSARCRPGGSRTSGCAGSRPDAPCTAGRVR